METLTFNNKQYVPCAHAVVIYYTL